MEWYQVSPKTALGPGERVHGNVGGRFVTVVGLRLGLRCIDSICYHAGGPLGLGDIEEIGGEACITCAWHNYPVSLEDGSKLYQGLELDKSTKKLIPSGWKKKPHAQRVHDVESRVDGIWVRLRIDAKFDSDAYAHSQACGERIQRGDVVGAKRGGDGIMPAPTSGQVLAEQRWKHLRVVSNTSDGAHGFRLVLDGAQLDPKPKSPLILTDSAGLFTNVEYVVIRVGTLQRYFTPVFTPSKELLVLSIRDTGSGITSSLARLRAGDTVDVRNTVSGDPPSMDLAGLGGAHFPQQFQQVLLIAAGSGVVPMYNVCVNVLDHTPSTRVTFVHVNRTKEAVMCRDLLLQLDPSRVTHVFVYPVANDKTID
ncbi:hypothetical protein BASA82_000585 [Batrachochytrium salamandrivorans]|nr:hypothetical protein BASA82_000585 [Batrachochytrium salamandrivorans]